MVYPTFLLLIIAKPVKNFEFDSRDDANTDYCVLTLKSSEYDHSLQNIVLLARCSCIDGQTFPSFHGAPTSAGGRE